jgi:hypothetical protein
MKLRKFKKVVSHGGVVPPGWRMAWYEPRRRVGVYYPAPLHWILRAWREFRYRAELAARAPSIERAQFLDMQRTHRERQQCGNRPFADPREHLCPHCLPRLFEIGRDCADRLQATARSR